MNSSRTQRSCSSPSDVAAGLQPHRRRATAKRRSTRSTGGGIPASRCNSPSVRTVAALGCSVLMEIGPQPVLTGAAVQVWPEHLAAPRAIVSLRKGVGDRRQIADALAAAYVGGHRPDFAALHQPRRRLELPTYPFQRRRFWPKTSGFAVDGPAVSGYLAVQRISPPETPSTPAGCPSSRSRGCPITSSTAPLSSRGDVCDDGIGRSRSAGPGERCLLLRADHPAREEFSRGAADIASAGGQR